MSILRSNFRYVAVLSLVCLTPAVLATAQAQPSDVISTATSRVSTAQGCLQMDDVLDLAGRRAPSVMIARASEEEASADIDQARSLYRPRLDAVGRTGVGDTGVVDSGVSNSVGFRASQRVIDFGDAKYARRSARADFAATQNNTRQAARDASTQAGFALLEYYEALAQIELTNRRYEYFAQQLRSIDNLLQTGGATRTERASVASQLSEAEGFVLELEFRRDRARTQIEIATRATSPICNVLKENSDQSSERYMLVDQAVTDALAYNPTLGALRDRAEGEAARAKRETRARLPIISVVATGAYSSIGGFDQFEYRDRVGIDVTVPLYAGNSLRAQKRRANARETAARARVFDQELQLREDVTITWQRLNSLKKQLASRIEVERQTRLQFEAAEIEAGAGTITYRDLVELRLEFEQAGLARIRTTYDLEQQKLILKSLTGQV